MVFVLKKEACITCVSLMLIVTTVSGYTHTSSQRLGISGGGSRSGVKRGSSGAGDSTQTAGGHNSVSSSSSSSSSTARCQDGWLLSHNYCLLYTGLTPDQAELFCAEEEAEQAKGICVKKPMEPDTSTQEVSDDVDVDEDEETPSSSSSYSEMTGHECPAGWVQYNKFCFLKPGPSPHVCSLLGAEYMFHFCVIRIPHLISTDFLNTVKRLDGDDQTMHRSTRMCCCLGGGLCKK